MLHELGGLIGHLGAKQAQAEASTAVEALISAQQACGPFVARTAEGSEAAPSLEVHLLGPFRVFANDQPIDAWPNGKGRSIFKFLATHRGQPVQREVLMETFWPESEPDAARNNLNVAVYGLRKALARADPSFPFVLFRQGCYSFNPALRLWVDAEVFVDCVRRGQLAEQRGDAEETAAAYRVAMAVYRSALLVDDRYEDWLIPHRQALQEDHARMLQRLAANDFDIGAYESCATVAARMLEGDNCNEEAHRLLMRCHSRMGQIHLALRQYHFCVDALARELNTIPSLDTVALSQQIRQRQPI
jgi:DNA-binding SARP family transcriptional activator